MTLRDLSEKLINGRIRLLGSGTGRVLLQTLNDGREHQLRYFNLTVRGMYLKVLVSGHLDDFAQPVLMVYVDDADFAERKKAEIPPPPPKPAQSGKFRGWSKTPKLD